MQSILIVANGAWPEGFDLEQEINKYATVVALDGAANHLVQSGLFPDVVLGDFDSIDEMVLEQCKAAQVNIVATPDQERSDISKGLEWVHKTYPESNVDVVGVEIGRYDHHLAAYSALFECNSLATIILDGWEACRVSSTPRNIDTKPDKSLSLLPFGTVTGVHLEGCQYPLQSEILTTGTRGISNKTIGSTITASVETGHLLLLVER
jgi:thiamine pyrophosphokinase